jgi:hypothetical protein
MLLFIILLAITPAGIVLVEAVLVGVISVRLVLLSLDNKGFNALGNSFNI